MFFDLLVVGLVALAVFFAAFGLLCLVLRGVLKILVLSPLGKWLLIAYDRIAHQVALFQTRKHRRDLGPQIRSLLDHNLPPNRMVLPGGDGR